MKKILMLIMACALLASAVPLKAEEGAIDATAYTAQGFAEFGAAYGAYAYCTYTQAIVILDQALADLVIRATERNLMVKIDGKAFSYGAYYFTVFDIYKDKSYTNLLSIPREQKQQTCLRIQNEAQQDLERLFEIYEIMSDFVSLYEADEKLESA